MATRHLTVIGCAQIESNIANRHISIEYAVSVDHGNYPASFETIQRAVVTYSEPETD